MEYGADLGDKIIDFSSKNPEEAKQIFANYGKVVGLANIAFKNINTLFEANKSDIQFTEQAYENLLRQAKNLLLASCDIETKGSSIMPVYGKFAEMTNLQECHGLFKEIISDVEKFNSLPKDMDTFANEGINMIDRYLFDNKNFDLILSKEVQLLLIGEELPQDLKDKLSNFNVNVQNIDAHNYQDVINALLRSNALGLMFDSRKLTKEEKDNIFYAYEGLFQEYGGIKRQIQTVELDPENPSPPINESVMPFSFGISAGTDLIEEKILTLKDLLIAQESPDFLKSDFIAEKIKYVHDVEKFDLRSIEQKTTDTTLSLHNLEDTFSNYEKKFKRKINKVIEFGIGYGRLSLPLIKEGIDVVGVDVSERNLDLLSSSYQHMAGSRKGHLTIVKANFADKFFWIPGQIGDLPDCVTIMWHTFNFSGSPSDQLWALRNANKHIKKDGLLVIEVPDRNFGEYRDALADYYKKHPDVLPGTIEDAPPKKGSQITSEEEGTVVPRYFPGRDELRRLIEQAGFKDVNLKTYFVRDAAGRPVIKELLYTAIKA